MKKLLFLFSILAATLGHAADVSLGARDLCSTGKYTAEGACPCDVSTVTAGPLPDSTSVEAIITLAQSGDSDNCAGTIYTGLYPDASTPSRADVIAGTGATDTQTDTSTGAGSYTFDGAKEFVGLASTDYKVWAELVPSGSITHQITWDRNNSATFTSLSGGGGGGEDLTGLAYFVNSVTGNDSNDGLDPSTPWATPDNVYQLPTGSLVCLMTGSTFSSTFIRPQFSGTSSSLGRIGACYIETESGDPKWYDEGTFTGRGAKPILTGDGPTNNGIIDLTSGEDYLIFSHINVDLTSGGRHVETLPSGNTGLEFRGMEFEGADGSDFGALRFQGTRGLKVIETTILDNGTAGERPGYGGNNAFFFDRYSRYLLMQKVYCARSDHDCIAIDGSDVVIDEMTCDNTEIASNVGDRCMSVRSWGDNSRVYIQKLDCIAGGEDSAGCNKMQTEQYVMRMSKITTYNYWESTSNGNDGLGQMTVCCSGDDLRRSPVSADGVMMWNDYYPGGWAYRYSTRDAWVIDATWSTEYRLENHELYANYFATPVASVTNSTFSLWHHDTTAQGDDFAGIRVNSNIFQDTSANTDVLCQLAGTSCVTGTLASLEPGIGSGNEFSGSKACTGNYPQATVNGTFSGTTLTINEPWRIIPEVKDDADGIVYFVGDSISINGGAAVKVLDVTDDGLTYTLEASRSGTDGDDIDLVGITANCRGVPTGITPGWTG